MSFITVHVLRALPMHNLNRDQNGLPKSQYDGGIQRGRLSSQSLKRPARIAFRDAMAGIEGAPGSIRTMDSHAAKMVVSLAEDLAVQQGKSLDHGAAKKKAESVVKSLAKKPAKSDEPKASADSGEPEKGKADQKSEPDKKDNILLFSLAELETLAQAILDEQNGGDVATVDTFLQDFRSPSLDIAAFGRMFAARADKSTQAAVAVSHAVMTHEMSLTIDYFTAVDEFEDDAPSEDAGAAHLGLAYYTSGVYYSTFTIDPAQLARSWSGFGSSTARAQVEALVKALVEALPTGKLTNTNAHTKPCLVLVENQKSRTVYEFETPVLKGADGGFSQPSVTSLSSQYATARAYDRDNYLDTVLYSESDDTFDGALRVSSIGDVANKTASMVWGSLSGEES